MRNIIGDPLENMPSLDPNPPPFQPTGRYTEERRDKVDMNHQDFLLPKEWDLMHDFMCKQNQAFSWNNLERGCFKTKFFPPVEIPVVPHVPFIKRNIPIPPGIYQEVCAII